VAVVAQVGDEEGERRVALARARSPGSGRNDRMCAAQKAWLAVTDRKNVNPSWRAAY